VEQQEDNQVLIAEAMMGKLTEEFIRSELGAVMLGLVEQDEKIALAQLSRVFPWRRRRIQQLQNDVRFCQLFKEKLIALVQRGASAMHEIELRDQNYEE
jgi:hypothetical protein